MTQPQAPAPVTPAPRQKRNSAYCVVLKVQIPLTDSASLVAAMLAGEGMAGAGNWPEGSVVSLDGQVRKV